MFRKWLAVCTLLVVFAMLSGCAWRERRGGLLTRFRGKAPCATYAPYSRPVAPATPCEYTIPGPIWDAPLQGGCDVPGGAMPPINVPPPAVAEPPNGTAPRQPAAPSKLVRPGQTASASK